MSFDKTYFPYFQKFCIEKFGPENGSTIYAEAESIMHDMIKEADYRGNKYIKWHMDTNMLPAIAIYLAFKNNAQTDDKALEYTDEVMQTMRLTARKKNQKAGRLPFAFQFFKIFCKSVVKRQYPREGWDMEWIRYDKKEIHFNMKSCIYFETTKKYGCAEMCPLFCKNDDVTFSGYSPAIEFERSGTIALGQDICDFHFKSGKYIK